MKNTLSNLVMHLSDGLIKSFVHLAHKKWWIYLTTSLNYYEMKI